MFGSADAKNELKEMCIMVGERWKDQGVSECGPYAECFSDRVAKDCNPSRILTDVENVENHASSLAASVS